MKMMEGKLTRHSAKWDSAKREDTVKSCIWHDAVTANVIKKSFTEKR